MNSQASSNQFAYSPDRSMLGAVLVPPGTELGPSDHRGYLAARLQWLLDLSEDPQALRRKVELEYLEPLGFQFENQEDEEESPEDAAGNWVESLSGLLNLAGAVYGRKVKVDRDDPRARAHLEGEREEPEQALLAWVSLVTNPVSSEHEEK